MQRITVKISCAINFLISFIFFLIILLICSNYSDFNFFLWFFRGASTFNSSITLINLLYNLSFGFFSWAIVIYFFGTLDIKRYKRWIKSIILFFPFWLGIIFFLSSLGSDSYKNTWLLAHILLRFWVFGGFSFALLITINVISYRLDKPIHLKIFNRKTLINEKEKFLPRSKFVKFLDFLEKYQILILISIISFVGLYITISSFLKPNAIQFSALTFLFLTFFIISLLFFTNYTLSINNDYHMKIKEKEITYGISNFETLLKESKNLVEHGNVFFTEESFELAIEIWEEAAKIYKDILRTRIKKKKIKENLLTLKLDLIEAYKGATMNHLDNAQKAYKSLDLKAAQNEWISAIKGFNFIIRSKQFNKSNLSKKEIQIKIKEIEESLKRLEIEMMISETDEELKSVYTLQDKEILRTIEISNDIIKKYFNIKKKARKLKEYERYSEMIQNRLFKLRAFQEKLQEKMDKLVDIKQVEKRVKFDINSGNENI